MVHIALMGDPTLRLHPVAAPTTAADPIRTPGVGTDSIQITWAAPSSAEPDLIGYHVYRSASAFGPHTRLTTAPIAGTTYTDPAAPQSMLYYQVRAVVTTTSASGTYQNAGQAAWFNVPLSAPTSAPADLTLTPVSDSAIHLTWSYSGNDATHFRIERRPASGGTWATVATVSSSVFLPRIPGSRPIPPTNSASPPPTALATRPHPPSEAPPPSRGKPSSLIPSPTAASRPVPIRSMSIGRRPIRLPPTPASALCRTARSTRWPRTMLPNSR
jgi:hypothetical protein